MIGDAEFEYNYFNDVVKKKHPDEGTVIHEYDEYGKIIWTARAEDLRYNSDGSIYKDSDGNIIPDFCIVHVYEDMQREVAVYKRSYENRGDDNSGRLLAAHAFYKMDRLRDFYPFNAGNAYASGYLISYTFKEFEVADVTDVATDRETVRIYSSPAFSIVGKDWGANHVFLYGPKTGVSVGRNGSSMEAFGDGGGQPTGKYNTVILPEGTSELQFLLVDVKYNPNLNRGLYIPFLNDCHTSM